MKRLAFLLTAWIVVLAACSPGAAPAPPTAAPTDAPTAAPTSTEVGRAQGGTLKLLWWQAPTILNPHLAQGTKDNDASRLVLEPLAAIAPDGSYVPQLAAEIPTVDNGGVASDLKTTTWKLKSGVKWSDGTDFTADDVVFTWHYMSDKETAATDAKTVAGIDKVEAKDATTVVVTWHDPNPNPLQALRRARPDHSEAAVRAVRRSQRQRRARQPEADRYRSVQGQRLQAGRRGDVSGQ